MPTNTVQIALLTKRIEQLESNIQSIVKGITRIKTMYTGQQDLIGDLTNRVDTQDSNIERIHIAIKDLYDRDEELSETIDHAHIRLTVLENNQPLEEWPQPNDNVWTYSNSGNVWCIKYSTKYTNHRNIVAMCMAFKSEEEAKKQMQIELEARKENNYGT